MRRTRHEPNQGGAAGRAGSEAGSIQIAAVLLLFFGSPAEAQVDCDARASISVGHGHGVAGQTVAVPLRGRSACEVNGFGLAIGHHQSLVEFVDLEPGPFLENHAGSDLFVFSSPNNTDGFVSIFVAFDLSAPLTVPPASLPANTLLATLFYRIRGGAPPGRVVLRNQDRTYGSPRIHHVFTTTGLGIEPQLHSGSITIQPFRVDAGEDRMLPEGSFVTLLGSASGFKPGAVPAYRWSQASGPPAPSMVGLTTTDLTVQLPEVEGDVPVVFELQVDDGEDTSRGAVEILTIDVDARVGELRIPTAPASQDLLAGSETLAFAGELEWGTDLEDGLWSEVSFEVSPHPVLDEIERATLYVDADGSGDVNEGDHELASASAPFAGGQRTIALRFAETLKQGSPVQFLLVVERSAAPAQKAFGPILAALAALVVLLAARKTRVEWRGAHALGWLGVALILTVLACSGGGGGSSSSQAGVVFSIDDESDVDLRGSATGTMGRVTGLPARGSQLNVE